MLCKVSRNDSNWTSKYSALQFPRKPEDSRLNSQTTESTRTEITAVMTLEVWKHTQCPTTDDYNATCKLLAEKRSALNNRIYKH